MGFVSCLQLFQNSSFLLKILQHFLLSSNNLLFFLALTDQKIFLLHAIFLLPSRIIIRVAAADHEAVVPLLPLDLIPVSFQQTQSQKNVQSIVNSSLNVHLSFGLC